MTGARTGVTSVTTPTDREIVVVRVVDAPRRMVFDAFSNPAHVPKWLLGPTGWTMPVCEIDLRPGGAWRYVWRKADGTEMVMVGTYREVVPPERIVWTESWGGPWPETVNTLAARGVGRADHDHDHHDLPVAGSTRRGAQDRHQGGHEP